jgi:hypothetical protein
MGQPGPYFREFIMSIKERTVGVVLVALFTLAGCVSTRTVPVDHEALVEFQGGTVVNSQREKPGFSAMTAGKAMFGAIGAVAMISAGNQIIRENDVNDPAVYISQTLLSDLAGAEALTPIKNAPTTDTTDVAKLAKEYSAADLLLDVQTVNWSFGYFPTNWNHYRVIYSVKVRLIDTRHGKLLSEGFCARVPEETPDAPTREQLLNDQAAGLKRELGTAADYCIKEIRTKVLQKS